MLKNIVTYLVDLFTFFETVDGLLVAKSLPDSIIFESMFDENICTEARTQRKVKLVRKSYSRSQLKCFLLKALKTYSEPCFVTKSKLLLRCCLSLPNRRSWQRN